MLGIIFCTFAFIAALTVVVCLWKINRETNSFLESLRKRGREIDLSIKALDDRRKALIEMYAEMDRQHFAKKETEKSMNQYKMDVEWSEEDVAFIARAPDLDGVVTHGKTRKEALANLEQAIEAHLESLARENS